MRRKEISIQKGENVLLDGPSKLEVLTGEIEIYGKILKRGENVIVRKDKRVAIIPHVSSTLRITSGRFFLTEDEVIPSNWVKTCERVSELRRGESALIIGKADSGKSTLAIYLINKLLEKKERIFFLEGDIGQPEIWVPTTISGIFLERGVIDLEGYFPSFMEFVGDITPRKVYRRNIRLITFLNKCGKEEAPVIINSDGWIRNGGLEHKIKLARQMNPQFIISFLSERLNSDFKEIGRVIEVNRPKYIKRRGMEERRKRRIRKYWKAFSSAVLDTIEIKDLKIELAEIGREIKYEKVRKVFERDKLRGILCGLYGEGKCIGVGRIIEMNEGSITLSVNYIKKEKIEGMVLGNIIIDSEFNEWRVSWEDKIV